MLIARQMREVFHQGESLERPALEGFGGMSKVWRQLPAHKPIHPPHHGALTPPSQARGVAFYRHLSSFLVLSVHKDLIIPSLDTRKQGLAGGRDEA